MAVEVVWVNWLVIGGLFGRNVGEVNRGVCLERVGLV
ncbi:MAG: hypothetical protein RI897_2803 [Verrucomicrobiota bacterium]|jgi:hypothetical protein